MCLLCRVPKTVRACTCIYMRGGRGSYLYYYCAILRLYTLYTHNILYTYTLHDMSYYTHTIYTHANMLY